MSGIITLLPVVILLVIAITTKKTTSALVIGALVAFVLTGKGDFPTLISSPFVLVTS